MGIEARGRYFWISFLFVVFSILLIPLPLNAEERERVIVLDPGHGDYDSGAEAEYDGVTVREKDLNLQIGKLLKEKLEEYQGVKVYLTRDSDRFIELEDRTIIAEKYSADALISLHNNANGPICEYDHGCCVLVSQGQYKETLAAEGQKLAVNILNELSLLGIENQGLLQRDSEIGESYENGEIADYYAIIRNGIKQDVMSVLIEHAFLDNEEDFSSFLSDEDKLGKLAEADAKGIARYFGLKNKKTGKSLDSLKNIEENILHIVDKNKEHNILSKKIYYEDKTSSSGNSVDIDILAFVKKAVSAAFQMTETMVHSAAIKCRE